MFRLECGGAKNEVSRCCERGCRTWDLGSTFRAQVTRHGSDDSISETRNPKLKKVA